MPLTPKQAAFVAAYVADPNATKAAFAAGYPARSAASVGSENLTKPEIIAALAEVHSTAVQVVAAKTDEAVGSAVWIIEKAGEVVSKALECDSDGNPRNISAATPALALLAKRHPEFRDSTPIDARSLTFNLPDNTSLEDLKRLRVELA